jgi:hypothetical protein
MPGSRSRCDDQFVNDAKLPAHRGRIGDRERARSQRRAQAHAVRVRLVTRISFAETPAVFAAGSGGAPDGKTVIVLGQGESE